MNKIRILLVDDHESFRHVLASFLRAQQGVDLVGEAVDGIDAIDQAYRLQPDLVLMDVHMPRRNGIEATRAIKDHNPRTVVIMMSVDSSENYVQSARMVADGYIPKSSMKMPLLSLIASEQARSTTNAQTMAV
jgi:two-component system, NarL family, response regulator NreC